MKCKGLFLNASCYTYAISFWLCWAYPSSFNADTIVRLILFPAAALKEIKLLQFSDLLFARKIYPVYRKQQLMIEVYFDRSSVLCAVSSASRPVAKLAVTVTQPRQHPARFGKTECWTLHPHHSYKTDSCSDIIEIWFQFPLWKLIHKEKMEL